MTPNEHPASSIRIVQWWAYYSRLLALGGKGGLLALAVVAIAWVNAGFYIVQPDEQGVVLRFGRWVSTASPGLHYHWPYPIETVLYPKVTQVNQLQLGNAPAVISNSQDESRDHQMLTGDENIVEADCSVLWRIKDAGQFLFTIDQPEAALKVSAESALREVISHTPIQAAMSDKRQQIADETRELLQSLLDAQRSGILVTQVQLQRVDPPAAVIDAFNDVQRARADQERARNEAEAYANDIIPRARGQASRIAQDAEAYKAQVIDLAQGDAKSFLAVHESYAKAKDVTAWRMYMESVDQMLRRAAKVILDTSGKGMAGVVPYLSLSEPDKAAAKDAAKDAARDAARDAAKEAGK
jgi:membrane protease subunit HflK